MKNFFYQSKTPIVFSRPNMELYTWQYLTNTSQGMLITQSLRFQNLCASTIKPKGEGQCSDWARPWALPLLPSFTVFSCLQFIDLRRKGVIKLKSTEMTFLPFTNKSHASFNFQLKLHIFKKGPMVLPLL